MELHHNVQEHRGERTLHRHPWNMAADRRLITATGTWQQQTQHCRPWNQAPDKPIIITLEHDSKRMNHHQPWNTAVNGGTTITHGIHR